MAHGRSSLMVAPHEPTSEACEPTCSPIRVRPGARFTVRGFRPWTGKPQYALDDLSAN
jgi:hypothetical protein